MGVLLFLLFPFRLHFPAVLPLILYGLLPLWPRVGAEGTFSFKSKSFSMTIRSLILDPWGIIKFRYTISFMLLSHCTNLGLVAQHTDDLLHRRVRVRIVRKERDAQRHALHPPALAHPTACHMEL